METPSTAKRRRILPEGRSREGGGTKRVGLRAVGFGFCKPGSRSLHAFMLTGAGVQESHRLTAGGNWRRERRGSERRCMMTRGRHRSLPGAAPPPPPPRRPVKTRAQDGPGSKPPALVAAIVTDVPRKLLSHCHHDKQSSPVVVKIPVLSLGTLGAPQLLSPGSRIRGGPPGQRPQGTQCLPMRRAPCWTPGSPSPTRLEVPPTCKYLGVPPSSHPIAWGFSPRGELLSKASMLQMQDLR